MGVAPQLVTGAAPYSLVASVSFSPGGPILDRGENPAGLVRGLSGHWAVVLESGSRGDARRGCVILGV